MRRILTRAALAAVLLTVSGCSSFFGRPAAVRTFTQEQGGNVIAGDSLGAHMHAAVDTQRAAAAGE